MTSSRVAIPLLVVLAALFAFMAANTPSIHQRLATNSDLLMPAELADNLLRRPDSVLSFELPRIPSLVPDLLVYLLLSIALPNWQSVVLAYAMVSFAGFVVLGGAMVARIAERTLAIGIGALLGVSALAMSIGLAIGGTHTGFTHIFSPVTHSGSFAMSLAGLLLARRSMLQPSFPLLVGLLVTAALGTVSNLAFLGSFLFPLLGAALLRGVLKRRAGKEARTLIWATAGCLAGIALDRGLFSELLFRQATPSVDISTQLGRIPDMTHDIGVHMTVGVAILVASLPATWKTRGEEQNLWWCIASITTLGFLGLLLLLYTYPIGTRYAQPIWWWAAIFVSVTFLRLPAKLPGYGLCLMGLAGFCLVAWKSETFSDPLRILRLKNPITACLAKYRENGIIHAGLGGFWTTRPVVAASDWSLQIEAITPNGHLYLWGNNRINYLQDKQNSQLAPLFDFVIMQRLDPAAIEARFGKPEKIIECPTTDVWIYSGPDGIGKKIGGIDVLAAPDGLADSLCFLPKDFRTRSGNLSPEGVEVPLSSTPHEIATWGPYARLRRGQWQIELKYSLTGLSSGTDAWDIVTNTGSLNLARGDLERTGPTSKVMTVPIRLSRNATSLEFRTFLQPGDRLRLESVRATRIGSPPITCSP